MRMPEEGCSGPSNVGGDYVLVSSEEEDLEILIPPNVDPHAFLEQVPWQVAAVYQGARFCINPWKRARLYLKGKLVDEFFFIADAWPKTQTPIDERKIA